MTKPLKISRDNIPAINALLASVNGKATSFAAHSARTVLHLAYEAECMLSARGVPKSLRRGCVFSFLPGGPLASAYKYAAVSTFIRIERRVSDWYLVEARRQDVWPRGKRLAILHITPAARDAMLAHALRGCVVQPELTVVREAA